MKDNTIIAQATPRGYAGIGIIRISGNKTNIIATRILGKKPRPRYAEYVTFYNHKCQPIDQGILLWFPKPNSFTGEDVLELHGHGGIFVLNLLLEHIVKTFNIRIANPGEFSKRAFLNQKIDLNQAEAISDLINAASEQEVFAAMNSLQGMFSKKIQKILEPIIEMRTFVEATIDFLEDKINNVIIQNLRKKIRNIIFNLKNIITTSKQNNILETGIKIAIVGKPNVGKSSLFNNLMKEKKSIVTHISGTTRDIIKGSIYIKGIKFWISDTAGLHNTDDIIEKIGISLAKKEIKNSDHILYILDGSTISCNEIRENYNILTKKFHHKKIAIIRNKIDLLFEDPSFSLKDPCPIISLSAKKIWGMNFLEDYLERMVLLPNNLENQFLAKTRHLQSLEKSLIHIKKCLFFLSPSNLEEELLAEELRLAQKSLDEITGKFTSEKLLHHIFSSFCIGK